MEIQDFSSSILIQLVLASFKRQGILDAAIDDVAASTDLKTPHIKLPEKRKLLESVYRKHGALPIIQAGYDVQKMAENPLSFAMLRAVSPLDLMDRFFKLQRYFHSKHRLQLVKSGNKFCSLRHLSTTSSKPKIYEDLLLAGLMAGLLCRYGCEAVLLCIGTNIAIQDGVLMTDFHPEEDCSFFTISWKNVGVKTEPSAEDEIQRIGEFTASNRGYISAKINRLISIDPLRKWSLNEMASVLNSSTRTLQRRLKAEGTSFGECVLSTRCQCAAYYMSRERKNLTSVGFLAGFSDGAHFSREFKKNMGLLPSNFQATLSGSSRL